MKRLHRKDVENQTIRRPSHLGVMPMTMDALNYCINTTKACDMNLVKRR